MRGGTVRSNQLSGRRIVLIVARAAPESSAVRRKAGFAVSEEQGTMVR
jgi:hypothetical protein